MQEKDWEKLFCFRDKCIWIGSTKFSPLRREYLSLAVNVLTKSLRIFHVTKKYFLQRSFLQIDQ